MLLAAAAQLNTINSATTSQIDATAVTALAPDTLANINQLLFDSFDGDQFYHESFGSLGSVTVSEKEVGAGDLNTAVTSANIATGANTTIFSLDPGALISADESQFEELLLNEISGQVLITEQNLTVDSGTLSVTNANLLDATTSGIVTANIATDSTIDSLATLTGTGNAYTIVIAAGDATGSTASELIAIDRATTVNIDASAITSIDGSYSEIISLYNSNGITGFGDENINITEELSVDQANAIDALTIGTVTATIAPNTSATSLATLTAGTNAYTIVIAAGDAQSITAAELNAINGATSLAVDASAVRAITYDTLENINILMTNATDTSQFSSGSFSNLSSVQVFNVEQYMRYPDLKAAFGENIDLLLNHYLNYGQFENRTDGIMDVSDLNNVIAQSNILTGSTSTQIKITQSSTINGGDEAEFLTLLTNESRGQINLVDNQIEVDSGTISLATYGLLDNTTTGQIYAIPRPCWRWTC